MILVDSRPDTNAICLEDVKFGDVFKYASTYHMRIHNHQHNGKCAMAALADGNVIYRDRNMLVRIENAEVIIR